MPTVSVLLAYHRLTPFLANAVRSVLEQTWRDLELIIVDDGAGAGLEPLGSLGADARIQLVRHETNRGIVSGVRSALARARGEFVALMDHDDIALPWRLERQLAALRAEPRLGLVAGRATRIDATGRVLGPEFSLLPAHAHYVFSAYSNPAAGPSYTGRREIFERFPWREELNWAGDYDFLARAAEAAPMRGIADEVLRYRVHPGQVTATRQRDQVFHACMARLLTARRRAGRAEDLAGLMTLLSTTIAGPLAVADSYRWFARRCLVERFPLLAVYLARKVISVERAPRAVAAGSVVLMRAARLAPAQSGRLARMFFTGPLRTHGLRPA